MPQEQRVLFYFIWNPTRSRIMMLSPEITAVKVEHSHLLLAISAISANLTSPSQRPKTPIHSSFSPPVAEVSIFTALAVSGKKETDKARATLNGLNKRSPHAMAFPGV